MFHILAARYKEVQDLLVLLDDHHTIKLWNYFLVRFMLIDNRQGASDRTLCGELGVNPGEGGVLEQVWPWDTADTFIFRSQTSFLSSSTSTLSYSISIFCSLISISKV